KAIERQTRYVRIGCKGGRIFWPACDDHQDRRVRHALKRDLQQLEDGWIHPMSIFQTEERWVAGCEGKELAVENLQCPVALLLRGKVETGVRGHVRDVEKLGIEWNSFLQRHAQIPEGALEASQLLRLGLRWAKVKGNSQVFDDRPERPVKVVR